MFKKYGDGKITAIIEAKKLTEEQQESVKEASKRSEQTDVQQTDTSSEKKSGS